MEDCLEIDHDYIVDLINIIDFKTAALKSFIQEHFTAVNHFWFL